VTTLRADFPTEPFWPGNPAPTTLFNLKLYVRSLKDFRALASVNVGATIGRPAGNVAFLLELPANSQHLAGLSHIDSETVPRLHSSSTLQRSAANSKNLPISSFRLRPVLAAMASILFTVSSLIRIEKTLYPSSPFGRFGFTIRLSCSIKSPILFLTYCMLKRGC